MELNQKPINYEGLKEVVNNLKELSKEEINKLVGGSVIEFPISESIKDKIYYYDNKYYKSLENFTEELSSPDNRFEELTIKNIIDKIKKSKQKADSRLVFAIQVRDGKFKYWSKDKNIKPIGIESVINQNENGIFYNDTNNINFNTGEIIFSCMIQNDKLYMTSGGNTNLSLFLDNYLSSSDCFELTKEEESIVFKSISNPYNSKILIHDMNPYDNSISFDIEYLESDKNNSPLELFFEFPEDNTFNFSITINPEDIGKKIHIFKNINTMNTNVRKCYLYPSRNNIINQKFKISNMMCIFRNSVDLPYFKNKMPTSYLCIKSDWTTETHSFVVKKCVTNYNFPAVRYVNAWASNKYELYNLPIGIGSDRSKRSDLALSKNVGVIQRLNNEWYKKNQYSYQGISSGYIALKNHSQAPDINEWSDYYIYEGQLTEEELKTEIEKNIIIPEDIINTPIPNSNGYDNGSFGTYNNINNDFPMIYNSYYEIISKEGHFSCLLSKYGVIIGDQKIKDVSGFIRVKDITAPYKLRILRNDNVGIKEKITDMSNYMANNFPENYQTITEITGDMLPEDTSECIDFSRTFKDCYNIIRFPELNTSKGINFSAMYSYTYGYNGKGVEYPIIDTSNGIDFTSMYDDGANLNSSTLILPQINTSKGKKFNYMYRRRSKVTKVSDIDLSSMTFEEVSITNMKDMLLECNSLPSVTFNNVPVGVTEEQLRIATSAPETCEIIINYREEVTE